MPTHEESFLQSILEQPDEDFPRLVYADWLEEQGKSDRAEFIRLQCQLAPIPTGVDVNDLTEEQRILYKKIKPRTRELIYLHQSEWLPPILNKLIVELGMEGTFNRGFIEKIVMRSRCFEEWCGKIIKEVPTLRRVELVDKEPDYDEERNRWFWLGGTSYWSLSMPERVPHLIFNLLNNFPIGVRYNTMSNTMNPFAFYPTKDEALEDLSHACLLYAKLKAKEEV